ncbi:MAG: hypothetical protein AABX96_03760 [Nanoarchaeota archaeon]
MKNKLIIIILGILIILSSIAIAYKEEIKQFSNNAIESYILEKIQTMPQEKQDDFNTFKSLSIENKFKKALEINKLDNSKEDNSEVPE